MSKHKTVLTIMILLSSTIATRRQFLSSSFSTNISVHHYRKHRRLIPNLTTKLYYYNTLNDVGNNNTTANNDRIDRYDHSLQNGYIKQCLNDGQSLTGVITGQYRDTDHIEILGLLGYDFLWIDCEHSSGNPDHVLNLLIASERRNLPTIVRIGYGYQNIIGHIQKYLVNGAQGILLPQCESKKDVEKLVEAVKFPPIGQRGLAGERWNAWGMARRKGTENDEESTTISISECVEMANANSIVGILIETQRGLVALDDIMTVPELDLIFLAPTDLSSDLGVYGEIRHPSVLQIIEETTIKIQQHNLKRQSSGMRPIAVGTLAITSNDYIYWRDRNIQVICGVAQCMFVDGAKGFIDKTKEYDENDKKVD